MIDTNKLDEIGMNTDTINMMKQLNMSNEEIFNELSNILTLYSENLINCLINDINEPLFQSILLRLKLQEKLNLNNDKLINSFTKNLHPLIEYLICENNSKVEPKRVENKEKEVEVEEESDNDIEENEEINNYIKNCILEEEGNFLPLNEVYDDYEQWLEQENIIDTKVELEIFEKYFITKYGNCTKKSKKKGWKNIKINLD